MCTSVAAIANPATGAEIKLSPVPESVQQARDFVRDHLAQWGFPKGAEDGPLVTSELATNAIEHAPGTPFLLSIRVANGWPIIEVADFSPVHPTLRPADYMSETGRGLHLVEALSLAWDSYPVGCGKVVWVQLHPK